MRKGARLLHGIAALAAWFALGLQLSISLAAAPETGQSLAAALWRFFGFFTVLTNFLIAIVASVTALAPGRMLALARVRFAALVAILVVGIVYSLALRHIWNPQGWQAIADHALHDATPLLFLIAWCAGPHGALRWRDALWGLVPGAAYLVYAVIRGSFDGWYAYYFLDLPALGAGRFLINALIILLAVLAISFLLVWIDRLLARRSAPQG